VEIDQPLSMDAQLAEHPAGRAGGQPLKSVVLEELQAMIDGLDEQVALVACDGAILAVNDRWRVEVGRQARSGIHISRDYVAFLQGLVEKGDDGARAILNAFHDVAQGRRNRVRCTYIGEGTFRGSDFNFVISGLEVAGGRYVLVSVHDVTELATLKRQRRRLGSQVLRAQEMERRRIARELHDSTSQMLVALQLNLINLQSARPQPETDALIADCKQTVMDMQREIRSLSFLYHPPSLSTNSLARALEDLTAGFATRTGLEIELQVNEVGLASASVEAAIYRLAQEALSNIHRHAAAGHALVRLIGRERFIHLMIGDDGIGFDPATANQHRRMGVGVTGMSERVRELGGRLSIHRALKGTVLTVSLPREKMLSPAAY
jgi:signal transduction histidine kinase